MDEIKNKFLDLIHKQQNKNMKIPAMGFSDYFIQNVQTSSIQTAPSTAKAPHGDSSEARLSDQEILEATEGIYFEDGAHTSLYELEKFRERCDLEAISQQISVLKQQHKVISKKVLQLILDNRTACNEEFSRIEETEKMLCEAIWVCRKGRSYLNFAKKNLTTTSLEILATYKKREVLMELLKTLKTIKRIKTTDTQLQELVSGGNYSGAIETLLECRKAAERYSQYKCVESLSQKLQDTLLMTEVQLDAVLNEMTQQFDTKKYTKLQEAYKLLGKTLIAMDQLHISFISTIHTAAFTVVRANGDAADEQKPKQLFEALCESVAADKYISCLINLCRSFWGILSCYYQVTLWHQNFNVDPEADEYIHEKLKNGQVRIWNDIQAKISVYLSSPRLHQLKFEQFIQVLCIIQRLKKVGVEFCGDSSGKLMESMKNQSMEFFKRYHSSCLEEISLFLDNEAWVCVNSFSSVSQLQEFKSMKKALQRHSTAQDSGKPPTPRPSQPPVGNMDNDSSAHSQDGGSSIYAYCGYFLRFSEKSSPFDGGFDESMLEEDILAGIADETSCYFSEESDDDNFQGANDADSAQASLIVNNTSLTVLRCIGRYLQMCRLLHSIAPQIVACMMELIDFFIYVVHEFFARDLPVASNNLYTPHLTRNLQRISMEIIPKVKNWPPSKMMIANELQDGDEMYGLAKRIVGIESACCLVEQFEQLQNYMLHLLPPNERKPLEEYFSNSAYVSDLRKPVYMCTTARLADMQSILLAMAKIKWDVNDVTVHHSAYIDSITRAIQTFAMRLEELSKQTIVPKAFVWDSMAHVLTHTLVEGFSNAKKCSTGGRAQMQLDFAHFISILELISGLKYTIHQGYVDAYVKAFYLPKDLLEEWIREQKESTEYSEKQLVGLVMCTCNNDKKMRQKLLGIIGTGDVS
ncbi:syndetin [Lutzomyia longipalpis]|uniref:syndetin n=1 Tax=Lutzomyia longipalpis TaxID=7200 RepID=UPI00248459C4|nr:syndetin [Lutzomyia longipalpis]